MVRRNAAGTKLYLSCVKGERTYILAVDCTGAITEIAGRVQPFTYAVLNSEEKPIVLYNSASETLTTEEGEPLLSDVIAFKYDHGGKYFAFISANEPESIRISSFNSPTNVLAVVEHAGAKGAFDIFSNNEEVILAVAEGFGRPLNVYRYSIKANAITLTKKRSILHPESKGIVNPGLYLRDMDVDGQVLLCVLAYDSPLAALDRLYLYDWKSGQFTACGKRQGDALLLQQCILQCATDSCSPESLAR